MPFIARLTQRVSAHNALQCQVGLSSSRSLGQNWRRQPGRPRVIGQTNFAATLDRSLPTSGDKPYCKAMVKRHNSQSRLCDDDNDDDDDDDE